MKIYKISQNINLGYDTYSDAIVIAENEEEAKKIHPNGTYDYHEDSKDEREEATKKSHYFCVNIEEYARVDEVYGSWAKKEFVNVEYVGEAKEGSKKGVVCASFHAG